MTTKPIALHLTGVANLGQEQALNSTLCLAQLGELTCFSSQNRRVLMP
jgi:hypothetical protein